jgi:hypothetical protein
LLETWAMKISGLNFFTPGSSTKRSNGPAQTPASGDNVQLSGLPGEDLNAKKGGQDSTLKKVGKGFLKGAMVAGGLAVGGMTAMGLSSIGASIGIFSLSLGLLATLSKDEKIKTMGYLLMLGPVAAGAGLLGAIGTGLSVGFGVSLAGQYGADGYKLASDLVDK